MSFTDFSLSNIFISSEAQSRSISAENPTGEKGGGAKELPVGECPSRGLGVGWKIRPCININAGEVITLADIKEPGIITHIWMTCEQSVNRDLVLRFYWDGEETPSVEVPYGDFFCNAYSERACINSIPVNVNPKGGFNSYWPMPFKKCAKITIENQRAVPITSFFYQVDYINTEVPENSMYFHSQWRRQNPVTYKKEYTILDNITGNGKFVGVYLAWGQNNNYWWGEGEVKFFIDGDLEFPTYCGTGTEDYFGGAWGFMNKANTEYETYSAPFLGYPQCIKPDGCGSANLRHGLYRWHIMDPIFFKSDFKATVQALGWRNPVANLPGRFLPLQDDISSTAFWYQSEPHSQFPILPDVDYRELI